jgi:FkbM family methyltransferase
MDFKPHPHALTRQLVGEGVFARDPLKVIDVGCSHGLSPVWRCFEPSLKVLAVDTDTDECRRLQSFETNSGVTFLPRRLGVSSGHPLKVARIGRDYWSANPWPRTSAAQAMSILCARESPSPKAKPSMSNPAPQPIRELTLDELVKEEEFGLVDVIKVDVDGPDLEVLVSGEQTIRSSPVLGVVMEVNFYGSHDETDHTFHATDRLMRTFGFELFDLTTRRCSVTALPGLFREENAPYETLHGRIIQGDALYLRDPSGWSTYPEGRVRLSSVQILKLATLMEVFGAPDYAAEILIAHRENIEDYAGVDHLLDLLAHQVDPSVKSYGEYVERFQADPTSHYPSRRRKKNRHLWPNLSRNIFGVR